MAKGDIRRTVIRAHLQAERSGSLDTMYQAAMAAVARTEFTEALLLECEALLSEYFADDFADSRDLVERIRKAVK